MNIYLLRGFWIFVIFMLSHQANYGQDIIRGPYLQSVYQDHITIRWRTDEPTNTKVWYGTSTSNLSASEYSGTYVEDHEVLLSGLIPNTKYYYAVGNSSGQLISGEDYYFETAPLPNAQETIRMWLLGDMGFGNNNQRSVRDAFYEYNQDEPIDLILTVGDNAYQDGTDEEFQDGWFENMYEDQLINTPVFLTYGNHDARSANGEDGTGVYFDIFNLPANGECGGYPSGNESYYSHNYANIHFISVNSWDVEHTSDSPMIQWLEDDLANNDMDWTIVMIHHPFYDGQKDNLSDDRYRNTKLRENMVPLFDQYEVDLVLMGHSHTYQRSYFIDGHYGKSNSFDPDEMGIDMGDGQLDGDGAYKKVDGKGIPYVICGTSGYALDNEDLNHPIMYYNELSRGSGYLELNYDQLDFKYITSEGIIADYFTIQKDLPFTVYDCPNLNSNFGVNCDDNNPFTYQDIVTNDCQCAGTTYDCTSLLANYGTPCNDNNPNTYLDKITEDCNCEGTPMSGFQTVSYTINSSGNDAEEDNNGDVSTISSDLELTEEESKQTIGLRFENVTIPEDAILLGAYIQFTADEKDAKITKLNIYGENNLSSQMYSTNDYDISTRLKTNTQAEWYVSPWNTIGEKTTAQRSPDLKHIIAEQLDSDVDEPLSVWFSNNSISFIIKGDGKRVAVSYDGAPNDAPQLVLEYAFDCFDADADGVCDANDDCPGVAGTIGSACDDNNSLTVNDVIDENCNCVGTVITNNINLTIPVKRSSDDAEQRANGSVSIFSTDLEMMMDGSNHQLVGIRFDEVNLPANAQINNAHIQFTGDESTAIDPCVLTIYGEASPNAATFTTQNENISSRNKTDAFVQWSPNTIWQVNDSSSALRTDDLRTVVSEIISTNGFEPNNAITFIIEGYGNRVASSYDSDPSVAPRLVIDYSLDCIDTDNDGICDSDDACPTVSGIPGSPCNDNNPNTLNDVLNANCNCIGVPLSGSVCSQIDYVTNDAEERSDGKMKLHSTDLELTRDESNQWIGLRFEDLNLPPGVSVLDARIQFTVDENKNEPGTIYIQGELGDLPTTFADINYNISDRPLTNSTVFWTPEEWVEEGDSGEAQRSVDLSPILHEIINQPDYDIEDPIVIIMHGTGKRIARSFNGSFPDQAPKLCVEYDLNSVNNAIINEQEDSQNVIPKHKKLITLYPNPTHKKLNVLFNSFKLTGDARVEVTDHTGKRAIVEKRELFEQQQTSIDVSALASGLYSIQIFIGKNHYAGKFVVIRD